MNTKFTTKKAKSIIVKYNKQKDNTMQSHSGIRCSPVFWVAAGPVMFINSIQCTYHCLFDLVVDGKRSAGTENTKHSCNHCISNAFNKITSTVGDVKPGTRAPLSIMHASISRLKFGQVQSETFLWSLAGWIMGICAHFWCFYGVWSV